MSSSYMSGPPKAPVLGATLDGHATYITPQPVGDRVTPTTPERTNRPMARVPLDAPAAGPDDDDEVAVCEVVVTFFANHAAATKREETLTLEALATLIHSTTANAKEQLPWLKFARFGDTRTEKGSLRHNANVRAITGLEGDYDRGEMSLAEAKDRAARAAIAVIIYPSPSYTPERPKWRVLCPFSQEYPPAARDRFMARLSGLFDGIFSREFLDPGAELLLRPRHQPRPPRHRVRRHAHRSRRPVG